jgi:copper transport protein
MDELATGARLAAYLGATWLFGLAVVSRLVLAAAPSSAAGTAWAAGRARLARRLTSSVDLAVVAVVVGTLGALGLQAGRMLDAGLAVGSTDAAAAVLETGFGRAGVLRLAAVLALWISVRGSLGRFVVPHGAVVPQGRGERVLVAIWLVLGAVVLVTFPLSGHAGAGAHPLLWVPVGTLHLGAAAVWLAGVGTLGLVLPAVLSRQRQRVRARVLVPVFERFARLAAAAVALLLLTGVVTAVAAVDEPGQLRDTAYGQALLVKVWLVASVLALGAANHVVLVPRMVRTVQDRSPSDSETTLAYTVSAEVLLGAVVLAVTAVLVAVARP